MRAPLLRAALLTSLFFAAPLFGAKPPPGPDVLIVADNFGRPTDLTRPAPEHPVYYIVLGGRQMDIGASVAGERMPTVQQVESLIENALASQGFVRTRVGGPMPAIVVVYTFGCANVELTDWSEDEVDPATGAVTGTTTYNDSTNAGSLIALVGGVKARHQLISSATAADLSDAAQTDRVYITVAALDAAKLRRKEKQIVWRTRISIPSLRHSLPDSMAVMLASAAPYFGGDTAVPVFIDDRDRRKTDVQIGNTEVVPDGRP